MNIYSSELIFRTGFFLFHTFFLRVKSCHLHYPQCNSPADSLGQGSRCFMLISADVSWSSYRGLVSSLQVQTSADTDSSDVTWGHFLSRFILFFSNFYLLTLTNMQSCSPTPVIRLCHVKEFHINVIEKYLSWFDLKLWGALPTRILFPSTCRNKTAE